MTIQAAGSELQPRKVAPGHCQLEMNLRHRSFPVPLPDALLERCTWFSLAQGYRHFEISHK